MSPGTEAYRVVELNVGACRLLLDVKMVTWVAVERGRLPMSAQITSTLRLLEIVPVAMREPLGKMANMEMLVDKEKCVAPFKPVSLSVQVKVTMIVLGTTEPLANRRITSIGCNTGELSFSSSTAIVRVVSDNRDGGPLGSPITFCARTIST